MNELLQNVLIDLIATVTSAKDFVLAELPEVVEQLLMWKMLESILYTLLGVAILACIGTYWYLLYKHWDSWSAKVGDPDFVLVVPAGFATLFLSMAALFMINLTWLQILIAPKVYLIEYAASLAP